jgi:hypothetical protein
MKGVTSRDQGLPQRFVCSRARRNNKYLGIVGILVFLAQAIWFAFQDQSNSNLTGVAIGDGILVVAFAAFWIWSVRRSTIELTNGEMTYRTLIRTEVFRQSDIRSIHTAICLRGLRQVSQPVIEFNDGHEMYLTEFSIPTATATDKGEPLAQSSPLRAEEINTQVDLVTALRQWCVNDTEVV